MSLVLPKTASPGHVLPQGTTPLPTGEHQLPAGSGGLPPGGEILPHSKGVHWNTLAESTEDRVDDPSGAQSAVSSAPSSPKSGSTSTSSVTTRAAATAITKTLSTNSKAVAAPRFTPPKSSVVDLTKPAAAKKVKQPAMPIVTAKSHRSEGK